VRRIFLDHGVRVADDGYEPNDDAAHAPVLSVPSGYRQVQNLVMAQDAPGAGDWFSFTLRANPNINPAKTYTEVVTVCYNGYPGTGVTGGHHYGHLDLAVTSGAGVVVGKDVEKDPVNPDPKQRNNYRIVQLTNLRTDQDYTFKIFVAGHGAMKSDGTPNPNCGGDFSPSYNLAIYSDFPKAGGGGGGGNLPNAPDDNPNFAPKITGAGLTAVVKSFDPNLDHRRLGHLSHPARPYVRLLQRGDRSGRPPRVGPGLARHADHGQQRPRPRRDHLPDSRRAESRRNIAAILARNVPGRVSLDRGVDCRRGPAALRSRCRACSTAQAITTG